ncbi:hypothetical protein [Streptomyces sp. 11-1-2]|uniref:hypothetical protein n=1 Tax=unclassified Streptomyces TaxID=2593676 RepID=UPI0013C42C93|nr:hypothetical protein [Streptomyces sp. 11-1-2]
MDADRTGSPRRRISSPGVMRQQVMRVLRARSRGRVGVHQGGEGEPQGSHAALG